MKLFPALAVAVSAPALLLLAHRSKAINKNAVIIDGTLKGTHLQGNTHSQHEHPTIPVPPVAGFDVVPRQDWPQDLQDLADQTNEGSLPQLTLKHSPSGTFPNLVLLLRFKDHENRELPSGQDIDRLYNSEDTPLDDRQPLDKEGDDITPTGSVRQVYFANSHSTFTVETTVIDWITLSGTEKYYADGLNGLSKSKFKEAMMEALDLLDDEGYDFSRFDLDQNGALDGFGVLTSSYGAEFGGADCEGQENKNRIWSHKGGLKWTSADGTAKTNRYYVSSALRGKCNSNIVRMGVLCHELGHYLGLPDLYDTTFTGNGLGAYDFMSQSWGMDGSGLYPPNLSAWSKVELGWATAELIESDGEYELEASLTSSPFKVYKIAHHFQEGEYILMENRQVYEYDSKIVQGGIAIYHIDETAKGQKKRGFPSQPGWPQNGNHYKVALLPADGSYDLEEGKNHGSEGDLWHADSVLKEIKPGSRTFPSTDTYEAGAVENTGIRIYDFSRSGAVMTFKVGGFGGQQAVPTLSKGEIM